MLVAAGRADWEPRALQALTAVGIVVLKRCVDLPDLLGSAATGQADVAVIAGDLAGLDSDAINQLRHHGVRPLTLLPDADHAVTERLGRLGVVQLSEVDRLPAAVESMMVAEAPPPRPRTVDTSSPLASGRVVAVWGPAGAPGRTTLAVALAAERATAGARVLLIDADPYAGAIGQQLGVLDQASGVLAAARLANEGALDQASFARCRRAINDQLEVLTGLPRPDRWVEVRSGVLASVLELARGVGDVVVDCGFSVEDGPDLGPLPRNTMTLESLVAADEVVLVGSAEPIGLARLARALVELRDVVAETPARVVVNRMRDSLGWRRQDIVGMVEGYAPSVPVHFLPEDRPIVDRCLVAGKAPAEMGESALRAGVRKVADAVFTDQAPNSR